ncbi:unnamed protein product, partial [Rhizoctonia solani]
WKADEMKLLPLRWNWLKRSQLNLPSRQLVRNDSYSMPGTTGWTVLSVKFVLFVDQGSSVEQSLEYQATWNMAMLQSSDTTEAFKAFTTKQPPRFKPLPRL